MSFAHFDEICLICNEYENEAWEIPPNQRHFELFPEGVVREKGGILQERSYPFFPYPRTAQTRFPYEDDAIYFIRYGQLVPHP